MGRLSPLLLGLKEELKNIKKYDIPWSRRLWLYRHGFTSSRDILYEINKGNIDNYLSDIQQVKSTRQLYRNISTKIAADKYIYHVLMGEVYPEHVPELIAGYKPGHGVVRFPGRSVDSLEELIAELERRGSVVIKRKGGGGGRDVHVLESDGGNLFFDGDVIEATELWNSLESSPESIVTEYIAQADYSEKIYPTSANTIRFLTMVDPETDTLFPAAAIHRFGATGSKIDNWSAGGMSAKVDIEKGELGMGIVRSNTGEVERVTHHPDTGEAITGVKIPKWDEIRSKTLEIANEFADVLTYVGWDILVTDGTGSFKIIEANPTSQVEMIQSHQPLLADDRTRRFYEHHGVL
jgi:hypothetical protein